MGFVLHPAVEEGSGKGYVERRELEFFTSHHEILECCETFLLNCHDNSDFWDLSHQILELLFKGFGSLVQIVIAVIQQ